jgi:hypothetical protein
MGLKTQAHAFPCQVPNGRESGADFLCHDIMSGSTIKFVEPFGYPSKKFLSGTDPVQPSFEAKASTFSTFSQSSASQ